MRPRSSLRRLTRHALRSVLATVIAGGLLASGPAVAATASSSGPLAAPHSAASSPGPTSSSSTRAAAARSPEVQVAAQNAGVLTPNLPLTATITIDNVTSSVIPAGSISLRLGSTPLTTRSELASWRTAEGADRKGREIAQARFGPVGAGRSASVDVTVPAAVLGLGAPAVTVYGLTATVQLSGADSVARGLLIWNPGSPAPLTRLAIAVPLTVPADAGTTTGLIPADTLRDYTRTNGVLSRELDAIAGHDDIAIGIDPMIIASIRALSQSAPTSATDWLARLDALPNDTFPLQYGDADVAGQVQSGLPKLLAPTSLRYALSPANFANGIPKVGASAPTPTTPSSPSVPTPTPTPTTGPALPTLAQLTAWHYSMTDIAWPATDTVRATDPAVFAANGLTTTLLAASNTEDTTRGPSDAHARSKGAQLLVGDDVLSDALAAAASAPDPGNGDAAYNAALARANAELAVIGTESGGGRTVLALAGRGAPQSWVRMSQAYTTLTMEPWSEPATITDALAAPVAASVSMKSRPESAERILAIQGLTSMEQQIAAFSPVVTTPETLTGRTRARLLALLGTSWLGATYDWPGAVTASNASNGRILTAVHIDTTTGITLVSNTASIPITVTNDLADLAIDIVLRATPSNGRLEVRPSTSTVIQPSSSARVLVPVTAKLGNGRVRLTLDLLTTGGTQVVAPVTVPVTVHADWEGIATVVIGVALLLLLGAGVFRTVRRRRNGVDRLDVDPVDGPVDRDGPVDDPEAANHG